ncbi:2-isopropylmalate synthase [Marinobacter sp. M-5]|uniref:2-isopropylmalate synthase n=1 Tax=Marinobacter sp. M-5 TaxID=3081089 RepID=UPI00293C441F|nr:2-isopropylmalate synthase [Marinobacter sp. M-5]MDV3505203.1 2-isopropylmalate synthase [Marinobacter sp. M-5]
MTYSEADRQYYLAMAGIQLWYAREPLSGAAPSAEFSFPETPVTAEPADLAPPVPPAPSPVGNRARSGDNAGQAGQRIANLQALMSNAPSVSDHPPPASPEVEVAVDSETPAIDAAGDAPVSEAVPDDRLTVSNLRVTMGLWVANSRILVGRVSEDASEGLQDTLANNILAVMGASQPVEPDYLRWPVFANPLVPGNGFADFSRLLASMAGESEGRQLILLGVLPELPDEEREPWLAQTLGRPAVDFRQSLAELAAVPAHKRSLWQALKPLLRSAE